MSSKLCEHTQRMSGPFEWVRALTGALMLTHLPRSASLSLGRPVDPGFLAGPAGPP